MKLSQFTKSPIQQPLAIIMDADGPGGSARCCATWRSFVCDLYVGHAGWHEEHTETGDDRTYVCASWQSEWPNYTLSADKTLLSCLEADFIREDVAHFNEVRVRDRWRLISAGAFLLGLLTGIVQSWL